MTSTNITHDALGFNVDMVPVMGTSLSPPHADSMLAMIRAKLGAKPARKRKPRKPTLASVAKQANKPGIARIEMKPDGTVVIITGKPESAEMENPWSLDEFRTKENKQ